MSEEDPGQQSKQVRQGSGCVFSFFGDLFSQVVWDALTYVIVGLFRGVGILLGWMLELLP